MRSAIFRQYDSRWGSLKYPSSPYTMKSSGCGCCACTHLIIEQDKYKNYTPKDVRPYMVKQGFATKGNGTTWTGMTKTLEHYGYTVKRPNISTKMSDAWKELNKGGRAGILLLKKGTRAGITWTSGGHYVAFLDYKYEDGKHYFYTKDSGARHNDGWHCYETTMKGLLPQIWIVKLPEQAKETTTTEKTTAKVKTKKATKSAQSYTGTLAGTYKTTDELNVRNGAGTDHKIMVTIPEGTEVKNFGYHTKVSKTKWLLVQFTYKNVQYTGFCSGKYLKKV